MNRSEWKYLEKVAMRFLATWGQQKEAVNTDLTS